MRREGILTIMALLLFMSATLLGGCGSAKKEGAEDPIAQATSVGSDSCLNCHAASPDVTGNLVGLAWGSTTHTTDGKVQCENCHGPGSLHWGLGPIPFPNPQAAQCAQTACHPTIPGGAAGGALTEFNATRHANANLVPDASFSQIPTPVSLGRHVEECSVCHNPSQRFSFNISDALVKPDPNNLPSPVVSCASCHDGHLPQLKVAIAQRSAAVGFPVFRKFIVNPSTGQQVSLTAPGAQLQAAFIFQSNGAALPSAGSLPGTEVSPDYTKVIGTNNEVNPDRLCAACHTTGQYRNSGGTTHQANIHTQWTNSGHGDRNAPAFAEFSANPPAYIGPEGTPYPVGDHRTTYPIDMKFSGVGLTATQSRNGTYDSNPDPTVTSLVNNFVCFKCHNGLTSIAYQDNVEGNLTAPNVPVVFGDATVTCVTCHDSHRDVPGNTKNTRKPQVMTKYSAGGLVFSGNVFLDNTAVPAAAGNETICIFCHQGRESGFTLFRRRLASDTTLAGSFLNEHYLGTGAMLWARNAYEYGGKLYGEVTAHQQANCNTCHMSQSGRNDLGGHSWRIFSEADLVVNNASCNVPSCHAGRVPALKSSTNPAIQTLDTFRDTVFDPTNDYDGNGIIQGIPVEISNLCLQLIAILQANGVFYNDLAYPYFFTSTGTAFQAWTLPTLKAAFNLQFVIKGLPSQPTSQIGQPNPSAAAHNYRYNIQILRDSYDDLQVNGVAGQPNRSGQPRPTGTRPATNYLPQNGGYNPRQ